MFDLAIRNGTVVTPSRVGVMDVGIQGDEIAALGIPGAFPSEARRTIDATGKIAIPGGIEPHAHIATPVPALWAGRPGVETQPPEAATRAAAFGGTTTVVDFARPLFGATPLQAIDQRMRRFAGNSYIDFAFHCVFNGESTPEHIEQIPELTKSGVASMKVWALTRPGNPRRSLQPSHGRRPFMGSHGATRQT